MMMYDSSQTAANTEFAHFKKVMGHQSVPNSRKVPLVLTPHYVKCKEEGKPKATGNKVRI